MSRTTTYSINCKGRLLDLSKPVVMGILNITPDSFYDGGRWQVEKQALWKTEQLLEQGAKIIDVGGVSTRPGAKEVEVEEELRRVIPVIKNITRQFPKTIISIDTYRAEVARQAVANGAHLVNDISAGQFDKDLIPTVGRLGVPYVLMHMKGQPKTMQQAPDYQDVTLEIFDFFVQKIQYARNCGVEDIILDLGFGFGKTIAHNYTLLKKLPVFRTLGLPLLTGISRKSMIWKFLEISPEKALPASTALHLFALQQGAQILRVHDAKEATETIKLWNMLESV